jgi:hypothetical protein
MNNNCTYYSTLDEKNFIAGLGTGVHRFGTHPAPPHLKRIDFLIGYKKALNKRVNWGSIEKDVVIEELEGAIAAEEFKERFICTDPLPYAVK